MTKKKKIVEQVLRDRCKEETSIFKTVVDSVTRKIFLIFSEAFKFLQFSRFLHDAKTRSLNKAIKVRG